MIVLKTSKPLNQVLIKLVLIKSQGNKVVSGSYKNASCWLHVILRYNFWTVCYDFTKHFPYSMLHSEIGWTEDEGPAFDSEHIS